jgi:hypothetical protein
MIDSAELEAALRANLALIEDAQRLLTSYLSKDIESAALVDRLLTCSTARSNARRSSLRTRRSQLIPFQG